MIGSAPKPPEPTNPAIPIALDSILQRPATENWSSRQELGRTVNGVWTPYTSQQLAAAFGQAFKDPKNPNLSALSELMAAESRTIEDPRVRAMRERQQGTEDIRRQIGEQYMNRFVGMMPGGAFQGLPPSLYGLPAGSAPGAGMPPGWNPGGLPVGDPGGGVPPPPPPGGGPGNPPPVGGGAQPPPIGGGDTPPTHEKLWRFY
jgi:hypothetical protein